MFLLTNLENGKEIVTKRLNTEKAQGTDKLTFFRNNLDCRMIDIVNLTDDIAIVCDDEGMLVSGNPVFLMKSDDGREYHIAGKFMLAKNKMTDDGVDTVPFKNMKEFQRLMNHRFKIGIAGVTQ